MSAHQAVSCLCACLASGWSVLLLSDHCAVVTPALCAPVVDLDLSKAQRVAEELKAKGARSVAIQADVSSKKDCQR